MKTTKIELPKSFTEISDKEMMEISGGGFFTSKAVQEAYKFACRYMGEKAAFATFRTLLQLHNLMNHVVIHMYAYN